MNVTMEGRRGRERARRARRISMSCFSSRPSMAYKPESIGRCKSTVPPAVSSSICSQTWQPKPLTITLRNTQTIATSPELDIYTTLPLSLAEADKIIAGSGTVGPLLATCLLLSNHSSHRAGLQQPQPPLRHLPDPPPTLILRMGAPWKCQRRWKGFGGACWI
jgi:hypothetical protein